jgi:hypothetical protein
MKTPPPQIDLFTTTEPEPHTDTHTEPHTSMNCAVLQSITSPDIFKIISINDVLADIKTEKYKAQIDALPPATDKKAYTAAKKNLPAWALNGGFTGSVKNSGFTESNGLFHIDIDGIEDPHALKWQLAQDIPEIYALWLSPSGNGLKGLIRIPDDLIKTDSDFKKAFTQIAKYLAVYDVTIDKACKDVRRLCFVGCDADIYINTAAPAFTFDSVEWDCKPAKPTPTTKPTTVKQPAGNTGYIARCCELILTAGQGGYHNARLRAGKLAGGFIAAGLCDETEVMRALSDASDTISAQCSDSAEVVAKEQRAIYDGIQHGKCLPVQEDNPHRQSGQATRLTDDIIQNRVRTARDRATHTSHNAILDDEKHHCAVDFLKAVDDNHLLKMLALSIAAATHLPAHTVFLMGLGVFASVACRRWGIAYHHGGDLPIGLYIVAEQPSGTAKSRCLKVFQTPFYDAEKQAKKEASKKLSALKEAEKTPENAAEMVQLHALLKSSVFTTNSTPEALEQSLTYSGGFFAAVSSEQGLFNTLLGGCYGEGKVSNNDLLLNGFDGGYMSSKRVGRDSYTGVTVGGAVMFAQAGGIETLLKTSDGTGLAERFLLIAEKHNLGSRNHTQTATINNDLVAQYNAACERFAGYALSTPVAYEDTARLGMCEAGWVLVAEYRNTIEPELADGGRYSHIALRGAAAKIDMQIMKIAANLHLLDNYVNETSTIDLRHVKSAIGIAHAMIEANLKLCTDKGFIGIKAEYTSILSLYEVNSKPRTEREIIQAKSKCSPFKEHTGNRSQLIRHTLAEMVKERVLYAAFYGGAKFYSLAQ